MNRWIGRALIFGLMTLPIYADEPFRQFNLGNVVQYEWGRLVSVYDQPNFQRMTFESDVAITVVQIGLTWDNKENVYRPSVRQIVTLNKVAPPITAPGQ
ncbi:hypothetical protein EB093_06840 [bacterium]|nr:hypothetical protein [bacterium]